MTNKFLFLLHETPGSFAELSPEEIQGVIEKYQRWTEKLAQQGRLISGEKLTDEGGKVVRSSGSGVEVTDGPYSEVKEVVGGFYLITAADYTEAVDVVRDCPHLEFGGRVEVRQIDQVA